MYVPCQPVPVAPQMRAYEWLDLLATWGMLAIVAGILWYEVKTYERTTPRPGSPF